MGVPLSGQGTDTTQGQGTDTTQIELPIIAIMDFIPKGTFPYEITI